MGSRVARVSILVLTVLVIGCARGDSDGSGTKSPERSEPVPVRTVKPGQHGPTAEGAFAFEGALELTGDYTVLYSFADEKTDTCGEVAGTEATGYVVPLPTFKDELRLVWTAGLREYGGPGKYDLADLGSVKLEVRKTPDAEAVEYTATKGATAELEVNKDNAGSLVFKGLKNSKGDEISGKASWTCTEGSAGKG